MITRDGLYPVVDIPPRFLHEKNLRAQWTGEPRRTIHKGEYYLSGAIVAAYRAGGDMGPFHPAKLVIATPVTTYRVEDIL